MVLRHEAMQLDVAQVCAFAAQSLREQKAWGILQVQRRGVELDKFHIADFGAGTICHGDAVPGGDRRVGGVAVELTHAAGGEQNGGSRHLLLLAPLVNEINAADPAIFHD